MAYFLEGVLPEMKGLHMRRSKKDSFDHENENFCPHL